MPEVSIRERINCPKQYKERLISNLSLLQDLAQLSGHVLSQTT